MNLKEIYREIIQDKRHNFYLVRVMREDDKIVNITAHKVIYKNQILELDEEEAGFCMIEKKDDDSVETLYEVKPKFRGTGLGGRLVDFTKEFAKKKGYRYVLLNKQERFVPHPLLKNGYRWKSSIIFESQFSIIKFYKREDLSI